jgi:hypothetical protein
VRFLLGTVFILIQLFILNANSLSLNQQNFIEIKKKRTELIIALSQSVLQEEKEALKKELQLTQLKMAKQLNSDLNRNYPISNENPNDKNELTPLVAFDKLDERLCHFYNSVDSYQLLEQFYLPRAPINKFWEGAQLLIREVSNINSWFRVLSESIQNNIIKNGSIEADEIFKLLNEGSAIPVLESLKRLEQFLESERITLILKYDEIENLIPTTYTQLHNIIDEIELASKNVKPKESALLDIFNIISSKNNLTQYSDRIDFMMRVILGEIIFRAQYEKKEDIKVLALFDTINVEDQNKVIDLNKINLACQSQEILEKKNIYFTNPVFEINSEKVNTGMLSVLPVLKSWTSYVEPKCLKLKQWQTNHNFLCDSDSQEGCDRSLASSCLPLRK